MTVNALDHFNVIAADLDATARFYSDVLGLDRRDGPPGLPRHQVQWMYDDAGRAIVHINSMDCPRAYDRAVAPGPTGAVHHIALNCSGFDAMIETLDANGVGRQINRIESVFLRQLFIHDPNDVVLELNYWGE
jgi:catechol 2,3-dioxygenase-like lactoylglutathione lyase family enzyme